MVKNGKRIICRKSQFVICDSSNIRLIIMMIVVNDHDDSQ